MRNDMNRSHPDNPSIHPPIHQKMCPEYQSKWDKMMHFGCEMVSAWLPFGHNFGIMRVCPARSYAAQMIVRFGEPHSATTRTVRGLAHAHAGRRGTPDPSENAGRVATHDRRRSFMTILTVMRRHCSPFRVGGTHGTRSAL